MNSELPHDVRDVFGNLAAALDALKISWMDKSLPRHLRPIWTEKVIVFAQELDRMARRPTDPNPSEGVESIP
jgi:hypothetical protein